MAKSQQVESTVADTQVNELPESNNVNNINNNTSLSTEEKGGETTVERNFVNEYREYKGEKQECYEKQERYYALFASSHPLVEKWNKATELWRRCHFLTKTTYPELVKHWDSFFESQKEWRLQRRIFAEQIEALNDPDQPGTDDSIAEAKACHKKYHSLIVPKEIVDLWRTEFKNPARKAWIADRVEILLEEASAILRIFKRCAGSGVLRERLGSLNLLKVLRSLKEDNWALTDELPPHEKQARCLAFRKFKELYHQKVDEFHSSEELDVVLTRNLMRVEQLTEKLKSDKSQTQRRVFLERYARAYRAMRNAQDTLVATEVEGDLDLSELNDELNESQINEFAQALVDWLKTNMKKNHKTYQALRSFTMKFVTGGRKQVMIEFKEETQGRMASGAAVIDEIVESQFKQGGLLESCVAWKFDRSNLRDKDIDKVWEAVHKIAEPEKMIPIANNGSRMLIRLYGDDGQVTAAAQFLDALFENFSQVGAYGLSILAAGTTSEIGGAHNTPINSNWDEDGRDCKVVLYDSKAVDWLPGTDGGGLNNMNVKAQHRCFSLSQAKQELIGAFFKGLTAGARMTIVEERGLWSVKDLINLAELSSDQFCEEFGYEQDTEENREEISRLEGHFTCRPDATELQKWEARNRAWDEWFESNKDLPYVFGLEVGQLKGRGKKHLAAMMPELQDVPFKVVDGDTTYKLKTRALTGVKHLLKAHGGWFEISADVYGWSIIDCPDNSSTSLNYQPMSLLIYSEQTLKALQDAYQESTNDMVDSFSGQAFQERDSHAYNKLMSLISSVVGSEGANQLGDWATCLLRNPLSRLSRWATNFDRTHQKTLRLLMTDHGEYRFTGLTIVDDSYVRKGKVRQLKRAAQWRGPLLVESALQANWCISGELAAQLLDAWRAKQQGKSIDDNLADQLDTIIKRLAFKRGETESTISNYLSGILRCIMDDAALVKLGKELVIMDVTDVENMQGDDDGDTVVLDFDEKIVRLFAETETFWDKFKKANGFRTLQIEMDKKLQIDFAKANPVYSGKSYDDLCDQGKSLIDTFGIEVPEVAKHYGLVDKIPSPLGLNFGLVDQIERDTKGGFFRNLAKFAFKTGSTPTGPIGAFSNVAPDLAIRALRQMDPNTYVLNEYGKRLWQGYATIASGVQVSIDWAKRVYDIINLFYYDQKKDDGLWAIDFEQQLTPDNVNNFLVKNTFKKGIIARFDFQVKNEQDKWVKFAHKMVRFKVVEQDNISGNPTDYIADLDTTKIYEISQANLDHLGNMNKVEMNGFLLNKVRLTEVNLMDAGNACFDFDSVYAIGSFMIQPPMGKNCVEGGVFQENAAVWKTDLPELLGKKRGEALGALNNSYENSALVAHLTRFLGYAAQDDSKIKQIVELMPLATKLALANPQGQHLDALFDRTVVEVASFFDANGASDRGELNKAGVIRAIAKGFGLSMQELESLYVELSKSIQVKIAGKDYDVNLVSIVSCLMRKDTKYLDEDVPQNMTQMILSDFLEKTEQNPFVDHVDAGRDFFINQLVVNTFGHEFVDKNNQKSVACFYKQPNKFFTHKLLDFVLGRNRDGFINAYMVDRPWKNGEGSSLHWKGDSTFWRALRWLMSQQKLRFCNHDYLWNGVKEIFVKKASEEGADLLTLQKQLFSAVRRAMSDFDRLIRTFSSYSEMKVYPGQILSYTRTAEGGFRQRMVANIDPQLLTYTNFAGQQVSTAVAFKRWVLGGGRMRLPDAQHNRNTQFHAIHQLVEAGFVVKSWSFFGDIVWRSKAEFDLLRDFSMGGKHFNGDGTPVSGSCPPAQWLHNVNLFSLNGAQGSKIARLPIQKFKIYQEVLDKHFQQVIVGAQDYGFFKGLESPVIALMREEHEIVQVIDWLRDGAETNGGFNHPPCNWLSVTKAGKALHYDGKDYFKVDGLIATLSKSLRWS